MCPTVSTVPAEPFDIRKQNVAHCTATHLDIIPDNFDGESSLIIKAAT